MLHPTRIGAEHGVGAWTEEKVKRYLEARLNIDRERRDVMAELVGRLRALSWPGATR